MNQKYTHQGNLDSGNLGLETSTPKKDDFLDKNSVSKSLLSFLNIGRINRILIIGCIIVSFIVGINFFLTYQDFQQRYDGLKSRSNILVEDEISSFSNKITSKTIFEKMKKRNIFTLTFQKKEVIASVVDYKNLLNNLSLVGIIWSDNPQAMIEIHSQGKTFLVGTGDPVDQFFVKKIYKSRIILTDNTNEWELR